LSERAAVALPEVVKSRVDTLASLLKACDPSKSDRPTDWINQDMMLQIAKDEGLWLPRSDAVSKLKKTLMQLVPLSDIVDAAEKAATPEQALSNGSCHAAEPSRQGKRPQLESEAGRDGGGGRGDGGGGGGATASASVSASAAVDYAAKAIVQMADSGRPAQTASGLPLLPHENGFGNLPIIWRTTALWPAEFEVEALFKTLTKDEKTSLETDHKILDATSGDKFPTEQEEGLRAKRQCVRLDECATQFGYKVVEISSESYELLVRIAEALHINRTAAVGMFDTTCETEPHQHFMGVVNVSGGKNSVKNWWFWPPPIKSKQECAKNRDSAMHFRQYSGHAIWIPPGWWHSVQTNGGDQFKGGKKHPATRSLATAWTGWCLPEHLRPYAWSLMNQSMINLRKAKAE